MKRTLTGWIGKSIKDIDDLKEYGHPEYLLRGIFKNRGKKGDWDKEDWPPRKIQVTVEIPDKGLN